MVVAIDVDDTLVPMLDRWFGWFSQTYDINPFKEKFSSYHLGEELEGIILDRYGRQLMVNPMAFWKNPNLYDDIEIDYDTLYHVRELIEYRDVVFVSHCFPEHEVSKRKMLERHFGNINFISTGAKEYVDFDWIIDDDYIVLNRCVNRKRDKFINAIQFRGLTRYNKDVWRKERYETFSVNRVIGNNVIVCNTWEEISEAILVKSEW